MAQNISVDLKKGIIFSIEFVLGKSLYLSKKDPVSFVCADEGRYLTRYSRFYDNGRFSAKITNDDASAVVPMVPEMVSIKHPLERPWSIWYNSNDKKNWEDCLIELTTFDTVEDYWCLYHHMLLPSELRQGQDYAVFKQGVRPMWEDSNNVSGGRWVIMAENLHHLNAIWLDIVLLLIGENFENMDMISGVIVNVRFRSKVVIWTTNKSREENIKIAKKVKNTIAIRRKFDFQAHNASKILFSL